MHVETTRFEAERSIRTRFRVGMLTYPENKFGTVTQSAIDALNHVFRG